MQVSSSPPFFEHQHERLEAQLHAHLLDVVGADFDSALQRLQRWRADLAQHIEIENTRLLPHVPPGARWAARVYLVEHDRIALLADEYNRGDMTPVRGREIMADQLVRLERKRAELDAMLSYVRAKIAWMDGGNRGPEPEFGEIGPCGVEHAKPLRVITAPRALRKPVARAA